MSSDHSTSYITSQFETIQSRELVSNKAFEATRRFVLLFKRIFCHRYVNRDATQTN